MEKIVNKIIAIDFDGVIVSDKYPEIGTPNIDIINKLKDLYKNNTLILWTCRNGDKLEEALKFCDKYNLKFHHVNENCDAVLEKYDYIDSRKITADIYVDDKGVTTL